MNQFCKLLTLFSFTLQTLLYPLPSYGASLWTAPVSATNATQINRDSGAGLSAMALMGMGNEVLNTGLKSMEMTSVAILSAEAERIRQTPKAMIDSPIFPGCKILPPVDPDSILPQGNISTTPKGCTAGQPVESSISSKRSELISAHMDALIGAIDKQSKDTCMKDSQNKKLKEIEELSNGVKAKMSKLLADLTQHKRKADEKKNNLVQTQKMLKGGGNPAIVEKLMAKVPNQCKNVIDESKLKQLAGSGGITGVDDFGLEEKTRINKTYNKTDLETTLGMEQKKIAEFFKSGVEVTDFQSQIGFIAELAKRKTAEVQQEYNNVRKALGAGGAGLPEKVEEITRDTWSVDRETASADGWKNKAVLDCINNAEIDAYNLDHYISNLRMDPKADEKRKADFQLALEQIVKHRATYTAADMYKRIKDIEVQSGIQAYFEGSQIEGGKMYALSDKFKEMQSNCETKVSTLKSNPYSSKGQSQAQIQNEGHTKLEDIKKRLTNLPKDIMKEVQSRLYDKTGFAPTPTSCEEAYNPTSLKFNFAKADECQGLMLACSTTLNETKKSIIEDQNKQIGEYNKMVMNTFNATQDTFRQSFAGLSSTLKAATSLYKGITFKELPNMTLTNPLPMNGDTNFESENNLENLKKQVEEMSNQAIAQVEKLKQDVKTETDAAIAKTTADLQKDRQMAQTVSQTCMQKFNQDMNMIAQAQRQQAQSQQAQMAQALNACVQQMNFNSADPGCLGTIQQLNQAGATYFSNSSVYPGAGYGLGAGAVMNFPQDRRKDCFASQPQNTQPTDNALGRVIMGEYPNAFKLCEMGRSDEGVLESIKTSTSGPLYSAYQALRMQNKLNPDQVPLFDATSVTDPMRVMNDLIDKSKINGGRIFYNDRDITETLSKTVSGSFIADFIRTKEVIKPSSAPNGVNDGICKKIENQRAIFIKNNKAVIDKCKEGYQQPSGSFGSSPGSTTGSGSATIDAQRNCANEKAQEWFDSDDSTKADRDKVNAFLDSTRRMLDKQSQVAIEAQNYAFSNSQQNFGQESAWCKSVKVYNALTPVLQQGSYSQSPSMGMPGGSAAGGFGAPGSMPAAPMQTPMPMPAAPPRQF